MGAIASYSVSPEAVAVDIYVKTLLFF